MAVNKVVYAGETLLDVSEDTATSESLFEGVTAHNAKGEKVEGTFPVSEVGTQTGLIGQIKTALDGKGAGVNAKEEQEKTVNITENGTTEISPDEGKTLSKVTVNTNVSGNSDNNKLNLLAKRTITEITAEDLQGVTGIYQYMFHGCKMLESISLLNSLTSIGNFAFYQCIKLTSMVLPEGIRTIGSGAFSTCTGLTTFTFKGTPTSIPTNAFTACNNLTTINVPWAEGAVADAPWGATKATINYNFTGE